MQRPSQLQLPQYVLAVQPCCGGVVAIEHVCFLGGGAWLRGLVVVGVGVIVVVVLEFTLFAGLHGCRRLLGCMRGILNCCFGNHGDEQWMDGWDVQALVLVGMRSMGIRGVGMRGEGMISNFMDEDGERNAFQLAVQLAYFASSGIMRKAHSPEAQIGQLNGGPKACGT